MSLINPAPEAFENEAKTTAPIEDSSVQVMQSLEDSLQRGMAYAKENPALAAIGVASVAALLIMGTKKVTKSGTTISALEGQVRHSLNGSPIQANGVVDNFSGAIGRALTADPQNVLILQNVLGKWLEYARGKLQPFFPDSVLK